MGHGEKVGRDLRSQRDDDVSRVNLISFSNLRLMNLVLYFSCTCIIAPAFACPQFFFLDFFFCFANVFFFPPCARVSVFVLQDLSGVASPCHFPPRPRRDERPQREASRAPKRDRLPYVTWLKFHLVRGNALQGLRIEREVGHLRFRRGCLWGSESHESPCVST